MPSNPKVAADAGALAEQEDSRVIQILDLFCGIGGVAEATRDWRPPATGPSQPPRVFAAVDIDQRLATIYQVNHGVSPMIGTIESLTQLPRIHRSKRDVEDHVAKNLRDDTLMWWLSPPCQPYTRRGNQHADADPRSAGLDRILQLLPTHLPKFLGLENVPDFEDSRHHQQLEKILETSGYDVRTFRLCPTEWGVPMRRRRFYLLAVRDGQMDAELKPSLIASALADHLEPDSWEDNDLMVERVQLTRYATAMNILDADNRSEVASCFTSAYGSSPVRAGSYLRCRKRNLVRRFSPGEISSLMGFRADFSWAPDLSRRAKYRLLGNSLAVPVVRDLLRMMARSR